jgi:hypothetical protein
MTTAIIKTRINALEDKLAELQAKKVTTGGHGRRARIQLHIDAVQRDIDRAKFDLVLAVNDNGRSTIRDMVEELDFIRACAEAGGKHQHAYDLVIDLQELEKAKELIEWTAERIRRELEA